MATQTVEDLQIKIGSDIKQALSGMNVVQKRLDQLKAQLEKGFAPKMDAMKAAMQNLSVPLEKTAQAVKKSANQIAKEQANLQSKLQIIEEKAQAQIATALLKEEAKRIKAQEIIDKQADAQRRLAEVSKAAADSIIQQQNDIAAAVQRVTDKMQQQATGGFYKQETVPRTGAKMATQIFAEKEQAKTATPNSYVPENERQAQQLTGLQQIAARYYAVLDRIKIALNKVGIYGREAMGQTAAAVDGARKSTDQATVSTRKYGNEVKTVTAKAGGMFAKLGQIIKRALIIGTLYKAFRALFSFISNGIKNAIAAPEIENLFRVAMGNMADEAAKFATQFKKSLGVDEYATKQMLGTFQNMTTSMGVGANTAYTMSKSLTILANDMASLYNVPVEQAFENLQSAMTGQGRAVKKYGFIVNETTMKQAAWNAGLVAQGEALSEAQKPIAAYLVLLQQSKNAQGDMQRTLGSLQNQLRILKQNMTAAGRAIGEAFLPFIQAVVPWLNAFAVVLQRAGTALARFSYGLFGMDYDEEKKKQEQIIGGLGGVADAEKEIGDAADAAGKKAKGALGAFDKLNVIQSSAESNAGADVPIGGVEVPGIPGLDIPQGESPFEKMADNILKKLKEIKDKMMDLGLREVLDNFSNFFAAIKQQIDQYDFATAIKNALWNGFELAMSLLNAAQRMVFPVVIALDIPGIVYEAINTLSGLFETLNDAVRAVTPGLEAFVQIGLVPIAEWLGNKIRDGLKFLQEELGKIGAWFTAHTGDFTAFGEALGNLTNALWEVVKPLLDTAWDTFKDVISGLVDIILNITDALVKTLTPVINDIADWVRENKEAITNMLGGILKAILAFKAIGNITKIIKSLQKALVGLKMAAYLKNLEQVGKGSILPLSKMFNGLKKSIVTAFATFQVSKNPLTGLAAGFESAGRSVAGFLKNLSPMMKIGGTLAAVAAEFSIVSGAVEGLYNKSQTMGQAMLTIIPTLALVGAGLTAMLGPAGLVITAVAGVAAAIKGWDDAIVANNEAIANAIFYSDVGVKISDIATAFQNVTDEVIKANQPFLDLSESIDQSKESVSKTSTEVGYLITAVQNGAYTIAEKLPEIQAAFQTMYDETSKVLNLTYDAIVRALSGSVGTALERLGVSVPAATSILNSALSGAKGELEGYKTEFATLVQKMESGTATPRQKHE